MSATAAFAHIFNLRHICSGVVLVVLLILPGGGHADPTTYDPHHDKNQPMMSSFDGGGDDVPTMGELRSHAATIADILEIASERVEQLAATDAEKPALMEAIRHELSLSRRWNRHLGTILDEVAEARRALKAREREAAKEIADMTALAEEARLELMSLKKALTGGSNRKLGDDSPWSESGLDKREPLVPGRQLASNLLARAASVDGFDEPGQDLQDARARLSSLQEAQSSAVRDVEAVRAKIIEALETLADAQGNLPMETQGSDDALSSEDITAWAASMATKLNRRSTKALD